MLMPMIGALRTDLIGGDHVIDQRFNERGLFKVEEFISRCLGGGGSRRGRRLLRLRSLCRNHCGRAAGRCGATDDGAFQEIATIKFLFCHRLPSLPEEAQSAGLWDTLLMPSMLLLNWSGKTRCGPLSRCTALAAEPAEAGAGTKRT